MSSLNPFDSATTASMDPFWNMEMMLGNNMGYPGATNTQLGFPTTRGGNQVGFSNPGTPQIGMDLTEEADKWVVHADLPGFKDEDVELTIENGMLGVRATRDKTVESDTGITHRVERCFGEVRRAIRLPKGADQDRAQAHLTNGVLSINFPKLAIENVGKKIPLMIIDKETSSTTKGKKTMK